jgi:hypothetical protein
MKGLGLVVGAVAAISSMPAVAQNTNQVGTLVCNYGESFGMIVGSRQQMDCVFHRNNGDLEAYKATLSRVGLDVGVTGAGRMAWTVLTVTRGVAPRALAGDYVGASGDVTFGIGGGANVLIGGSDRTIALQPLSLDAQVGADIALGVAELQLR